MNASCRSCRLVSLGVLSCFLNGLEIGACLAKASCRSWLRVMSILLS